MKNTRAKHVRFHASVQCGTTMIASVDHEQGAHAKKLTGPIDVLPQGAVTFTFDGRSYLVPWTNVQWIELLPEDAPEPKGKKAAA